jgi:hypothetical protein
MITLSQTNIQRKIIVVALRQAAFHQATIITNRILVSKLNFHKASAKIHLHICLVVALKVVTKISLS